MFNPVKIDGTKIAELFEKTITNDIEIVNQKALAKYPNLPPRAPIIVSFCNEEDPNSVKYTQMKQRKAEDLCIEFKIVLLRSDSTLTDIQELIERFNSSGAIDGIMVQLPITPHLKPLTDQIINLIDPDKDVDGLTEEGRKIYRPATVEAVFQILLAQNTDLTNKIVAVVGSEGTIGKPLTEEIAKLHPKQLIKVDKKLPDTDIATDLKTADIVFSCLPSQPVIKTDFLKPGVIAYDVGLNNFAPDVYQIAAEYTPVIGGVGPNTVIALMRNIAKAYTRHITAAYDL